MKVYDATSIRNVAIVGHTGAGKTQLASAILANVRYPRRTFSTMVSGPGVLGSTGHSLARLRPTGPWPTRGRAFPLGPLPQLIGGVLMLHIHASAMGR